MDNEETEETGLNKRAIIVVALPVLLVAVFLILFFTVFSNPEETEIQTEAPIQSNIDITEGEQKELEGQAISFIKSAGEFGVRPQQISAENIDEVATLLETDPDSAKNYYTSRATTYEGLDRFISEHGTIYYPESTYLNWDENFETASNVSFTVDNVIAESSTKGSYIEIDGERLRSVEVNVRFNSQEKMYLEQGSEIGAERSYSVMEKDFNNTTATLVFVYDDHIAEENEVEEESQGSSWRIYDINNLRHPFLLATWDDPNTDDYADIQFGFVQTDKIVPPNQNIQPALPEESE